MRKISEGNISGLKVDQQQPTPHYFYVFVRQDLSLAQQIVQSNHATFEMAKSLDPSYNQIPFLVVIGVPDKTALFRVINK